jgi:1,4-dihydroxy-2-naphthoate polyprenyltransferase
MGIKLWLKQSRADFLILSVALCLIGGGAAWYEGSFGVVNFILTIIGVIAAHASVNLFNEYSDWQTGIDSHTPKTPFSGGTKNLQNGLLKPSQVENAAYLTLGVACTIGIYLGLDTGWPVFVMMAIGGFAIVFYTNFLARFMLGEITSGIALGSLVVIGSYFVQVQEINSFIIWASIAPGILTMQLLFLNEFPDAEADKAGGRRHIVVIFGKKVSSVIYSVLMAAVFIIIAFGSVTGIFPVTTYLALLALPLAFITSYKALKFHSDNQKLVAVQGLNVATVLITDFLLAIAFFIG